MLLESLAFGRKRNDVTQTMVKELQTKFKTFTSMTSAVQNS